MKRSLIPSGLATKLQPKQPIMRLKKPEIRLISPATDSLFRNSIPFRKSPSIAKKNKNYTDIKI